MIYYFSGTGNSEWVARQIAAGTGDKASPIAEYVKTGNMDASGGSSETMGLVFPIHAWGAPMPVLRFAEGLDSAEGAYRFAVCTCGDEAGRGMERLARVFPLSGAWSIVMPNNYILMFDLDDADLAHGKVEAAKARIPDICAAVLGRKSVWDVREGRFPRLKTHVVNPLFARFALSAKGFTAGDGCNSCGLCVKACPVGNIALKDRRPAWSDHCVQCMACIHRCPTRAIQNGNATKDRGRYTFEALEGGSMSP